MTMKTRKSKLLYGGWSKKNIVKELYPGIYILNNKFIGGSNRPTVTFSDRPTVTLSESAESALLDSLIVEFYKGNIRSAKGVHRFINTDDLQLHGHAMVQLLGKILDTLRDGQSIWLRSEDAFLDPEHADELENLLLQYLTSAAGVLERTNQRQGKKKRMETGETGEAYAAAAPTNDGDEEKDDDDKGKEAGKGKLVDPFWKQLWLTYGQA